MNVVGVDLAGVENRKTGVCILNMKLWVKTEIVYTDEEIIKRVLNSKPKVAAIDAPLALPKGRETLEERSDIHLRRCDRELLRMGIKFFPITLGPMRKLTSRGIRLRKALEEQGLEVIETYPGAAQDLLGLPRKHRGVEILRRALIDYGCKGDVKKDEISDHELDAIVCALVGKMYVEGHYLAIGDPSEILMILPRPKVPV